MAAPKVGKETVVGGLAVLVGLYVAWWGVKKF
jgi:hypothetical protein